MYSLGVVIVETEGAVWGANLGHLIVINGSLLCNCAEVHELIELLFGMVSGVGLGIQSVKN